MNDKASFLKQATTAQATTHALELFRQYDARSSTTIPSVPFTVRDAVKSRDKSELATILGDTNFSKFADEAYDSHAGYAIRVNPMTGEKEMFVAGTRMWRGQWIQNVFDSAARTTEDIYNSTASAVSRLNEHGAAALNEKNLVHGLLPRTQPNGFHFTDVNVFRKHKADELSRIARENGVTVIYGHSRGSGLVGDMKVPRATKVALDGAMVLTNDKEMLNINEGNGFINKGKTSSKALHKVTGTFDGALAISGKNNMHMDLKSQPHRVWGD